MTIKHTHSKWTIFLIIVTATFMSTLDAGIINVALPVMAKELNVTTSNIQFVSTIYLLIISSIILLLGKLGDMIGKTKIFTFGVIVFTIGSLLCGLSNSFTVLIISRIIQAIGASANMAVNQGIITETFPQEERGKALGFLGTVVALGSLVGPGIGGLIVGSIGWKYIFFINIPIGIIDIIFCFLLLPKAETKTFFKIDYIGTILFALFIIPLFLALNLGIKLTFKSPYIIAMLIISLIAFISFIIVEIKIDNPLLNLKIFKNSLFSVSIFCGFISFVTIFCSNMVMPFYLQDAKVLSPALSGLILMVYPIVLTIIAPISGTLSDKIGSELLTFIGLCTMSLGMFLLGFLNINSSVTEIIFLIAFIALGMGLFQSPNNSLVMSTVSKSKLGVAGSINALVRNIGMSFGIVLSTNLLYSLMSFKLNRNVTDYIPSRPDVFIFGMRYVYTVAAAICLIGAFLTLIRLLSKKKLNTKTS